ncbi:hypothetical protein FRACYDRAFT_235134 [Fragilariopsis cylindrus CCMP1102]|uniref:Uncharacterized protein n=1 Tax=Fragilariopsis cylindrus CCMP1102 TaxID=635003 RepID=A0A1E7FTR3_9STRA|nr:hypothetical protein FRACYDRAFT_235134 [Fragilariopsis cylindrus CCMP1102]|eukprot:OEU21507.1 hypothetical protein FRACYDRAFT_235134 [Fragilariopsis cylindrus CCMP1102]
MHLFRNRNRPRTSFELKVGNCHLLEVTVHLRRRNRNRNRSVGTTEKTEIETNETIVDNDDWDWYNTNKEEVNDELLELLERSIISRMYGIEIEEYYQKFHPTVLPPKNNDINQIGSKNKNKKRKAGGSNKTTKTSKMKSSNAKTTTKKKKNYASFGKNNSNNNSGDDDDDGDEKPEKDIYFAFGELIELAFKKQPIDKDDSYSQTILYKKKSNTDNDDNDNDEIRHDATGPVNNQEETKTATSTTNFYDRQKLSSRLLVWISPTSIAGSNDVVSTATATATNKLDTIYEYRQEMIPISNLFRKPAEVIENEILSLSSDDDE